MNKYNEGKDTATIQSYLKAEHNFTCSVWTINRRIRDIKQLEQEARKDAIQEAAAKDALDCVSMLDSRIMQLNTLASDLLDNTDMSTKLAGKQMAETLLKYIDKKLNLTGMDKTDQVSNEEIVDEIMTKLGNLSNDA